MPEGSIKDGIGASVRRKEDKRFLTGSGRYTADITRPGQLHVHFVRSVHAHANIKSIRTDAAAAADGVVAIFTGEDVAADGIGGPICGWVVTNRDGSPTNEPPHPILANGTVRYVGDHVVAVIAESLEQAMNAAELVEIDYEVLAPVVDLANAGSGPQIHENVPGNMYFDFELGDEDAAAAALDSAATVVELEVRNNRLIPNAMEPRAALAEYDAIDDSYTLFTTSQNPHLTRLVIGAFMLSIPESKLRVVAPDVGGGFGSKIYVYPEEAVCTWASKKLQRPIKWTADRSESFLADAHGRDHINKVRMAIDKDNRITGLRVDT
ncbi:MAG: xanthine dehydrogenase family protein molybdopterin-binding subunit, partial [Candidatus Puniceispirillaceae bacterium]